MTPQRKLKLLLIHQFVAVGVVVLAIVLVSLFHDYGAAGAVVLLITTGRLTKRIRNPLKDTDVRLTYPPKHIYFSAGLAYFLVINSWLVWFAVTHSTPAVWAVVGLVMPVLLVILYAHADSIYGSKSRVQSVDGANRRAS
jgi:hypothetical protein